ncbi:MAG: hypothetical protein GY869_32025, partial [Planctomycetes bacterium]|nr:hypothetical protein [Planctomycetota bacterium]
KGKAVFGDSASATTEVIISGDSVVIEAHFEKILCTLAVSVDTGIMLISSPYGEPVSVATVPADSLFFSHWVPGDSNVVLDDSASDTTMAVLTGNATVDAVYLIRLQDIVATHVAGRYAQAFDLGLSLPGAPDSVKIYYTLDGSEPTEDSALFVSALQIDDTVTVKARAFCPPHYYPGPVFNARYFKNTPPVINVDSIALERDSIITESKLDSHYVTALDDSLVVFQSVKVNDVEQATSNSNV